MANHVLKGWLVKEGHRQHMHGVEPPPGLGYVFDDKIGGVMIFEPLGVLKRVMKLSVGHRARLEPTVKNFRYPPHG